MSVVVSLVLPKIYASTSRILPPQIESPSSIASSILGGVASTYLGGGGLKSPADLWLGILRSDTVANNVISRLGLMEVYDATSVEEGRKTLEDATSIRKSKEDIIAVTAEDKDPKRAARIAAAFVEELDRINRKQINTTGGRTRKFLEQRLKEVKAEMAKAEEELRAFQENNKAIEISAQSQATIGAIAVLKGQLMAREVEIQTALSYTSPLQPQIEIMRTNIYELKEKIKELEEGEKSPKLKDKEIFIPTGKLPALSLQYARLLRETKIRQTLFDLLTQQYEMAKIQEVKDTPTVQVLDEALVPEKKVKPRRPLIVVCGTVCAFLAAVATVFFREYSIGVKGKE